MKETQEKTKYIIKSVFVFFLIFGISYYLDIKIKPMAAMSLVTFFSVVYGFYITSTSIMFGSRYSKWKYEDIDEKNNIRRIYRVRNYLYWFGYSSIISIILLVVFVLLKIDIIPSDFDIFIHPFLLGFSTLNVYYMRLMLILIIEAMIKEAELLHKDKNN